MTPEAIKTRECADYILECIAQKRPVTASKAFATRHFQKAYKLLKDQGLIRRAYRKDLCWQLSPRGMQRAATYGFLYFPPLILIKQSA